MRPVLFIIAVYDEVVMKGLWIKVGSAPLEDELKVLPMKFIQDADTGSIELYDPNTGEITPSTREEVQGLECAAVWAANHVEDRLRDHFANVPNIWVKQLQLK